MTLDDLRARFPHLSLTLSAYRGQPVVLECIGLEGDIYKFTGPTEHDAIMAGFGEDLAPPVAEEPAPTPTTAPSVFD
jgi:hypothetical protein